jgi:hypothetical protein
MIYFFYGDDIEKSKANADKVVSSILSRKKDITLVKIIGEEISEQRIFELAQSQALFVNKYIIFLYRVMDNIESKKAILSTLKEMKESENIFVLCDILTSQKKTDLEVIKKIEEKSEKSKEFKKPFRKLNKKEELALIGEKIDFFEFANALGERKRKSLWVLFQDALNESVPAEEVHGIFFWQIKAMLLAKKCKTAKEAGMKDFPFQKAKRYAENYTEEELEKLSSKMVSIYHEAHRGNADMHIALERMLMEL